MYCKGLTKQQLVDMGIYSVNWDVENKEWWIDRYWFKNSKAKVKTHVRIRVTLAIREHKYGPTRTYPKVQFNYLGKSVAITLSRFLYAWFKGDIPDGYVVDHINNNPLDNSLNNLQIMTIEDNLAKRFEDNPDNSVNQYSYMDDFDRSIDLYWRNARKRFGK